MKKVIPNQTYNMHQIGVVLKGYQINNAMENAGQQFIVMKNHSQATYKKKWKS